MMYVVRRTSYVVHHASRITHHALSYCTTWYKYCTIAPIGRDRPSYYRTKRRFSSIPQGRGLSGVRGTGGHSISHPRTYANWTRTLGSHYFERDNSLFPGAFSIRIVGNISNNDEVHHGSFCFVRHLGVGLRPWRYSACEYSRRSKIAEQQLLSFY